MKYNAPKRRAAGHGTAGAGSARDRLAALQPVSPPGDAMMRAVQRLAVRAAGKGRELLRKDWAAPAPYIETPLEEFTHEVCVDHRLAVRPRAHTIDLGLLKLAPGSYTLTLRPVDDARPVALDVCPYVPLDHVLQQLRQEAGTADIRMFANGFCLTDRLDFGEWQFATVFGLRFGIEVNGILYMANSGGYFGPHLPAGPSGKPVPKWALQLSAAAAAAAAIASRL